MATKSTKFKYTSPAKAICLLLSVLLFSLGTWFSVQLGTGIYVYGGDEYRSSAAADGEQSYAESRVFRILLEEDIYNLNQLASLDTEGLEEALDKAQKKTVEPIVEQYIARQEYLEMRDMDPKEEIFYRSPTVNLSGNYDFDSVSNSIGFSYADMALTEEEILDELNRQYDAWEAEQIESYESYQKEASTWLAYNDSLKYYVKDLDGNVYTNLSERPTLASMKKHTLYAVENGKENLAEGFDSIKARQTIDSPLLFEATEDGAVVYFYVEDEVVGEEALAISNENGDEYIAGRQLYDTMQKRSFEFMLGGLILAYLLALALLLYFLRLVGHVNTQDGSQLVTAAIDRLPGDVHFFISAILLAVAIGVPIAILADQSGDVSMWKHYGLAGAGATFVTMLILAEWLASVCRTVKSGRGFWKNLLIWRICRWFIRKCQQFIAYCKKTWHLTQYVPKHLPKHAIWYTIGYVAINLVLVAITAAGGLLEVIAVLALIAFNVYALHRILSYLKSLDQIIAASEPGADMAIDETNLPVSLETLAGNMAVSRERIDAAVEKAVKEEQTRTELITNVTHDLKTPLTSLINYSDLLTRKAEAGTLGDEESVKYAGVIHDQSEKLKHLIDDLLEASKASAGNVQLNATTLNLTELAAQAIAEFAPEMSVNNNDVVFVDGTGQPASAEHLVYADGPKTYRILSNLLSNAKKYSAPGTRVYAVVKDGPVNLEGQNSGNSGAVNTDSASTTTQFEIKNVSAAPLNISAEELMARFVRGDRSRGETEGNGLGLSIARDLASLMGGSLDLEIDGDLFKATLTLPKEA